MEKEGEGLARKRCLPCEGDVPRLTPAQAKAYLKQLRDWTLSPDGNSIRAEYKMVDFMAAVDLIHKAARVAEEENHHPDLHLTDYRKLVFELSTHSIGGLSENDFILAAKIDEIPKKWKA